MCRTLSPRAGSDNQDDRPGAECREHASRAFDPRLPVEQHAGQRARTVDVPRASAADRRSGRCLRRRRARRPRRAGAETSDRRPDRSVSRDPSDRPTKPSAETAALTITNGRRRVTHEKNGSFCRRAVAAPIPTSTRMPRDRRFVKSLSSHARIRIAQRGHDASNASGRNPFDARAGPADVTARFQRGIKRGAGRAGARVIEGTHFGVRPAGGQMGALADDHPVRRYDNSSDDWIRAGAPAAALGPEQRALHEGRVFLGCSRSPRPPLAVALRRSTTRSPRAGRPRAACLTTAAGTARPRTRPRRTAPGPRAIPRGRRSEIGSFSSWAIAIATPPLAVPSSLVSTIPVAPLAARNSRAWTRPFWPTVASSTSSTSCGASGTTRRMTRRILSSSAIRLARVCNRPAVSTRTMSRPRALAAVDRIEGHGRRIGTWLGPDQIGAGSCRPDGQLLDRRGTKRVGRAHQHRAAARPVQVGQLANRRRLAGAVYADHEHHVRARVRVRRRRDVRENAAHFTCDPLAQRSVPAGPHGRENALRRGEADVGRDQGVFNRFGRVSDRGRRGARTRRGGRRRIAQAFANLLGRLGKALFYAGEEEMASVNLQTQELPASSNSPRCGRSIRSPTASRGVLRPARTSRICLAMGSSMP